MLLDRAHPEGIEPPWQLDPRRAVRPTPSIGSRAARRRNWSGEPSTTTSTPSRRLKAERNAIVLAHNYMTPDIFHGVADVRGDSLGLARQAAITEADVIVMAGVHFMAETAKITCPDKRVLIPDLEAGCSLASSITAADVRRLKAEHPGVPVVTYVNTSAEVKAETDICCTSSNAVEVVESLGVDRVIFLPDQYLGRYVASQTDVEIILVGGELRGPRALHRRRAADLPGRDPWDRDHRPPRVPSRTSWPRPTSSARRRG